MLRMFGGRSAGLPVRERRPFRLAVPGVVGPALHPRPTEPDGARPRQPAEIRRMSCAEDEVVEAVGTGDEGVLELVGAVDDAVARAYLVHLLVLPREPGAGEHEVDLLGGAVGVRWCRQLPGRDTDPVQADVLRAGGVAEPLPGRVHLALRAPESLDVVPVSQPHGGNLGDDGRLQIVGRWIGEQRGHVLEPDADA